MDTEILDKIRHFGKITRLNLLVNIGVHRAFVRCIQAKVLENTSTRATDPHIKDGSSER